MGSLKTVVEIKGVLRHQKQMIKTDNGLILLAIQYNQLNFKTSAPVTSWWVGSIPMYFRHYNFNKLQPIDQKITFGFSVPVGDLVGDFLQAYLLRF